MEQPRTDPRKLHLDCLRIVAMLFVIFNHTGAFGFFRFAETRSPLLYWVYLCCSVLSSAGVPIFFMISGALLIERDEPLRVLLKKRVLRIVIVIALFSLLQYGFGVAFQGRERDFAGFLRTIYTEQIVLPYWFLYSYLAFLLMLPFIRRMARGMQVSEYRYFFALSIGLTALLPIVQFLLTREQFRINLDLPLVTTTSVCFSLLGYALEARLPREQLTRRLLLFAGIAAVAAIAVCAYMTDLLGRVDGELSEARSQAFLSCLSVFPASALFLAARALFAGRACPAPLAACIRSLGGCTFGIYLFHVMCMDRLRGLYYMLLDPLGGFPACIVYTLAVFLAGYALTWPLKRVPVLKRLL